MKGGKQVTKHPAGRERGQVTSAHEQDATKQRERNKYRECDDGGEGGGGGGEVDRECVSS